MEDIESIKRIKQDDAKLFENRKASPQVQVIDSIETPSNEQELNQNEMAALFNS